MLATVVGKLDPTGKTRPTAAAIAARPLAGKSTLNRLELTPVGADQDSRYKKVTCRTHDVERLFVDAVPPGPRHGRPSAIVLDLDATDDPIHGHQLGRFFHGYYKNYCYLPLYIFCGDHLLCARLRPSDIDAAAGALKHLQRIVAADPRRPGPEVKITIRGDSGFCREPIMAWCEANGVDYLLGLAQNTRLLAMIAAPSRSRPGRSSSAPSEPARVFAEFALPDAGQLEPRAAGGRQGGAPGQGGQPAVRGHVAVGRGRRGAGAVRGGLLRPGRDGEPDQGAATAPVRRPDQRRTMRANQIRLFFSSVAYVLLEALRRLGLAGTELAEAQCQTIRLKLLKIGALVRVTVRKVWVHLASSYPYAELFRRVQARLSRLCPWVWRC